MKFFFVAEKKEKLTKDATSQILAKYLNQIPLVIIDIGAHKGAFLEKISKIRPIQRSLLVEPIPHLAESLRKKYTQENIRVIQAALCDQDSKNIPFYINEFEETSSLLEFHHDLNELKGLNTNLKNSVSVPAMTLDSLIISEEILKIDLLKVDVQGTELDILKGARSALNLTHYIWIELSFKPLYLGSAIFPEVYDYLQINGFSLMEISQGYKSKNGELLQVDALFANDSLNPIGKEL